MNTHQKALDKFGSDHQHLKLIEEIKIYLKDKKELIVHKKL
jgi:hypothetical protein